MKLNKINVYNFVVYKKQTFDFNKMFERDNILLIYGVNKDDSSFANDNGAGKSLIKEIVLFLLFGRTSKNTSKNLLIGKFDKYAKVKGIIEDDYNNKYIITRYINHPVHKNGIIFKINGENKTKGTPTELSSLIERSLGISYRRIMNTSIFEGDDNKSRFVYLGDKDAKSLLLQMKGLDIFNTCYTVANDYYKEAVEVNSKIQEKLLKINWKIKEYKEKIEEYNLISIGYEVDRDKKINEINKEIDSLKLLSSNLKDELLKELSENRKNIKALKQERPDENKIEKGNNRSLDLNSKMLIKKEILFGIDQDVNRNKQIKLNLLKQDTGEKCNHCGSIISNKYRKAYAKEIDKELLILFEKEKKLTKELDDIYNAYYKIENKTKKLKAALSNINVEITSLREISRRKEDSFENKTIEIRTLIKSNESKIDELKTKKNQFKELLIKEKKKKKLSLMKQKLIKNKLKKYSNEEALCKAWVDGFGQESIQTYALKSVIETFNDEILKISEILTDGLVDIKILTEKKLANKKIKNIFELKITDLMKKKLPFKEWSKGQKKRIEIITNFALMNLEDNVLREIFLDEVYDGLDKIGIIKIQSLLEKENKKGKRFIVFSHSEEVKKRFTNRGIVTLKNGCAEFELEGE